MTSSKTTTMNGWHKTVLFVLLGLLVTSVIARAVMGSGSSEPSADPAAGGSAVPVAGFVEGGSPAPAGQAGSAQADVPEGGLEGFLPFVTEGTFFALIGFALGYASRKVVKIGLVFVAIFFAGIQGLVYAGIADVDWSRAVELINDLVLNIQKDQTFTQILTAKLPTAGGLIAGYLLGFRRG
ncbi:FUN14 domain-containing protein [Engelhardtia mirabilis]|uniref:FUN14 family protein n=1 Tax=Engelhardtia mirabilis TaxID=2528011 RepID=A0A518BMP9_9BACT|nr:FUN14 family protein [Planctomycetes bacterium Pla133]QDV02585.1 FUN14 family protein [Planctomycetes bacterium Pla86]